MAYEPPFTRTGRIDALAMEIAEMVGSLIPTSELSTNPVLHRKLRIRTIRSSLVIEGNALSEEAVTAVLDGKHVLGDPQDIREVQNADRAYALLDSLNPGSIPDLLRAHKTMMEGLVSGAGVFRSKNVGVFDGDMLIHAGTPAHYVPQVMADLFAWVTSTDLHPLLASCIFHYEFEFIHPFEDGNGRTGRLWHTLLLSRWRPMLAWLPIESVILQRQQEYYASIARANAAGSCEAFVEYMLEVIRDALTPYARIPTSISAAASSSHDEKTSQGEKIGGVENTEKALLFFAENGRATVLDLADFLACSKRSAERIVADLKREGRLVREGGNRTGCWKVMR